MKELDVVKLKKDFEDLEIGTEGTIVYEHGEGCFEVEFFDRKRSFEVYYTR